jgi:methionyl-tRNA formyltransferase
MRVAYLGTSPFAAAVLRSLAGTSHRPVLVVTRPDRPRGRGRRLAAPPVAEAARELGLPLRQPASVNDDGARRQIRDARPDVLVVCAFGALIKEPLLSDHELLNIHPSLLPRWRGAAPIERAIMAGDERTGVCIMRLTAGLDEGPVALSAAQPITDEDTYGTLSQRLQRLASALLIDALDAGIAGLSFHEQVGDGVSYAEKITAEDRVLAPAQTGEDAAALDRRVRALTPHIGAAVLFGDGERLGVSAAHARAARDGDPAVGELDLDGERPALGCAQGTVLELDEVQPPGRRTMDAAAFLRGRREPRR